MPDYAWQGRTKPTEEFPKGLSKGLRTVDLSERKPEQVDVSAQRGEGGAQLHKCKVHDCGVVFKTAAIFSNHFRGSHKDLAVEKDSWRSYVETV